MANTNESAKLNLASILDIITSIDQTAIDDQLTKVGGLYKHLNGLDTLEALNGIDFNIYCNKTGKQLSQFNFEELKLIHLTNGIDKTIELIRIKQREQVSLHWIYTDPKSLDQLSEIDPLGYFVYAANFVLPIYNISTGYGDNIFAKAIEDRFYAQVELHKALTNIDLTLIIETNELMRRYLSIIKTRKAITVIKKYCERTGFLEFTINTIAKSDYHIKLFQKSIRTILRAVITEQYRRNRIKTDLTYGDVINLKLTYEGYSQFRGQHRLKSMTETEQILMELEDFIPPSFIEARKMEIEKERLSKTGIKPIQTKTNKLIELKFNQPEKPAIKFSFKNLLRK